MSLRLVHLFRLVAMSSVVISACKAPSTPSTVNPTAEVASTANQSTTPTVVPIVTITTEPAQTSTAAPASDMTAEPTVTLAPTVLPPTNIPDTNQPTAIPIAPGVAVFTSSSLGISFHYLKSANNTEFTSKESGDKVYVSMKTAPVENGQWVQVFTKPTKQSLEDALKTQVLKNYSITDCLVKVVSDPNKPNGSPNTPGVTFAMIGIPQSADDDMAAIQAKSAKCPQPYAAIGGLAYFMSTSTAPDRFAFFSIGQYMIPAEKNQPWQTTLKFIEPSGNTTPNAADGLYIDDRSNPERLITSLINAINRREYTRAYGYWQNTDQLAPYDQYVQGYANTLSVQLHLGAVRGSAGAGQFYYTIPAVLTAKGTDNKTQTFAACYVVHLSNPGVQASPPFNPMGIQKAHIEQTANNVNVTTILAQICQKGGFPNDPLTPPVSANAPDSQRYTDDRSGPVQIMHSLFNAINRREYSRAYSYWEPGSKVSPFDDFQKGYANTTSVALTSGTVQSDAGAGQLYYSVPVTLKAKSSDGTTQTFVGCYVFHLANAQIQSPPFQPLAIASATVKKVSNTTNTQTLMKSACPAR